MTQPQQYPPGYGAYPAQQPQYGQPYPGVPQQIPPAPPQGYPGAVVTYPAPPQQPAPQATSPAGGQALGAGAPPALVNGGGSGGSVSPKARHLLGRTVIVEPVRMGRTKNQETGQEVDEATFHLTVVDGGPLQYGDNQSRDVSKQRPNTHEVDTPCRFSNVSDIGYGFVQAVRDSLDAGELARVGVIQQGNKGNRPFLITKCETTVEGGDRPDGQARFQAAAELWNKIWQDKHAAPGAPRQFISPEPRSLVAPPPAAYQQPQVNYAAPAPPQGYPMPPAQAQAYVAQIPAQQPPNGAPFYGMAPQQPPPPAVAEPDLSQLPVPVQQWLASLDPATRAASLPGILAQYGAGAGGAPQAPAQPAGPGI